MATLSVLIQLPPCRFSVETLRPVSRLAMLAAILEEAGHETSIRDYGTVESYDRLFCDEIRSHLLKSAEGYAAVEEGRRHKSVGPAWHYRRGMRLLRERHCEYMLEIAREVASINHLEFVVVHVGSSLDLNSASHFCRRLRELKPDIGVVGAGSHFDGNPDASASALGFMDCICTGLPSVEFASLADVLSRTGDLSSLPNIAYKDRGEIRITRCSPTVYNYPAPASLYHSEVYPALKGSTKIKVFDVEVHVGRPRGLDAGPKGGESAEFVPFRKPARAIGDEVAAIHKLYGTRAFHFAGFDGCPRSTDALSFELLSRGLGIRYSRDADIGASSFSTIAAMKSSGCLAVSFDVNSGSQRLLDDYYSTYLSVSTIEDVIETARRAEVFTEARFRYPCVMDDYHTRAETLRLIERARPHSVHVSAPMQGNASGSLAGGAPSPDGAGMGKRKSLSLRRSRTERGRLCDAIEELGVHISLRPHIALLAAVCGRAGRESKFFRDFESTLLSGDGIAVASIVERVNHGARSTSPAVHLKPFVRFQNAIGN